MADLENLGILKPLMEMDSAGLELMNHFLELNASAMGNQYLGLMDHSNWPHQFDYQPCLSYVDNHPILLQGETLSPPPPPPPVANSTVENGSECKKRKVAAVKPSLISGSGAGLSDHEAKSKRKNKSEKGVKGKSKAKGEEKPREVVHVRARRGHATDSHSLAERVRREKINERMRCLQDLVPGCYKAMGMSVMLDEIIKYVRSLQNQVEFLSMKISAASAFYDFSLDMDAVQITQFHQRVNGNENVDVDRLIREGYGGGCTSFHPTLPF